MCLVSNGLVQLYSLIVRITMELDRTKMIRTQRKLLPMKLFFRVRKSLLPRYWQRISFSMNMIYIYVMFLQSTLYFYFSSDVKWIMLIIINKNYYQAFSFIKNKTRNIICNYINLYTMLLFSNVIINFIYTVITVFHV